MTTFAKMDEIDVLRVKLDAVIDARLDRGGQADFLPLRNYLTPKVLSELGY